MARLTPFSLGFSLLRGSMALLLLTGPRLRNRVVIEVLVIVSWVLYLAPLRISRGRVLLG